MAWRIALALSAKLRNRSGNHRDRGVLTHPNNPNRPTPDSPSGPTWPDILNAINRPPVTREGVTSLAQAALPTRSGDFEIEVVRVNETSDQAIVLRQGEVEGDEAVLVRLQSECLTGEVLGSLRCDCGDQLTLALAEITTAGRGVLIYLHQEGRGIGLVNKIRAYALQDRGMDTVEANLALGLPVDSREYSTAATILRYLGIHQVRLLTNNPAKCQALQDAGIVVAERVPLQVQANPSNLPYLRAKAQRLGHLIDPDVSPETTADQPEGRGQPHPA